MDNTGEQLVLWYLSYSGFVRVPMMCGRTEERGSSTGCTKSTSFQGPAARRLLPVHLQMRQDPMKIDHGQLTSPGKKWRVDDAEPVSRGPRMTAKRRKAEKSMKGIFYLRW